MKQDGLIQDQAKLSEKQFRLSSALGHQHIEPTITSWMAFPVEGPFYAWIANRGPISIVALSVQCWDVAFNAKDEVKIIGGSSYDGGQSTDPRYFFFKPQLALGETSAMMVSQDRQSWLFATDPARPEESRLTRLFYILKATYYRGSDLKRFDKMFAFEIADIRTFRSKRIESFEKHPDYQRTKFWLDKQRNSNRWNPELSGETQ